jgi:hypothetical protein
MVSKVTSQPPINISPAVDAADIRKGNDELASKSRSTQTIVRRPPHRPMAMLENREDEIGNLFRKTYDLRENIGETNQVAAQIAGIIVTYDKMISESNNTGAKIGMKVLKETSQMLEYLHQQQVART